MLKNKHFIWISFLILLGCQNIPPTDFAFKQISKHMSSQNWEAVYNDLDTYSKGLINSQVLTSASLESIINDNGIPQEFNQLSNEKLFTQTIKNSPKLQDIYFTLKPTDKIIKTEIQNKKAILTIENQIKNYEKVVLKLEDGRWKLHLKFQKTDWLSYLRNNIKLQYLKNLETSRLVFEGKTTIKKASLPSDTLMWTKPGSLPLKPQIEKKIIVAEKKKQDEKLKLKRKAPKRKRKVLKKEPPRTLQQLCTHIKKDPSFVQWIIIKGEISQRILTGRLKNGQKVKFKFPEDENLIKSLQSRVENFTIIPPEAEIVKQQEEQLKIAEEALRKKQKERVTIKEQIKIVLTDFTIIKADWLKGPYLDRMKFNFFIVNKSKKDIHQVVGTLNFFNLSGEKLYSIPLKYKGTIKTASKVSWVIEQEFNKYDNMIINFRNTKRSHLILKFEPSYIAFEK